MDETDRYIIGEDTRQWQISICLGCLATQYKWHIFRHPLETMALVQDCMIAEPAFQQAMVLCTGCALVMMGLN